VHARADGRVEVFAHQANTKRFFCAFLITALWTVIEAAGGIWTHSLAILGDSGHSLIDALALGLALLAGRLANRPPTLRHSFGLGRIEVLMADVNSFLMFALAVALVSAALGRLAHPTDLDVKGPSVIVIGCGGLVVNAGVFLILHYGSRTLNQRGAVLHAVGDLLGSLAVVVSGAVITLTGWMPIDPLVSLFIAALIVVAALRLFRATLPVLLEGVPSGYDLEEIGRTMAAQRGVVQVHDLHIWGVASDQVALAAHVVVDDLGRWDAILAALADALERRYRIHHVTLQPEPTYYRLEPLVYAARAVPPVPRAGRGETD
jgi:cobalt-zinc-cadmium efflux system protein